MQLLTVARRAYLGGKIRLRQQSLLKQIATARSYLDAVAAQVQLAPTELRFHHSMSIVGLVGIVEAYITDLTVEFLVCFPGNLSSKEFNLKDLKKAGGSVLCTVQSLAEQAVNKLTRDSFPEMVAGCLDFFSHSAIMDAELIEIVNEVKCTRNLFVHNNGIVNETYRRKAGRKARRELGYPIPVDANYVAAAVSNLNTFLNEFYSLGPTHFADIGKASAFREMWKLSSLNALVPFEDAWDVENPEMVRPKTVNWGWSSSEKVLYEFFLGIYSPIYPNKTTDAIETLRRWPPLCNESRIIMSWIESPFTF